MLSARGRPSPGSKRKRQRGAALAQGPSSISWRSSPPPHAMSRRSKLNASSLTSKAQHSKGNPSVSPGRLWQAARRPWAWRGGMGAGVMGQSEGEGEVGAVCALHSKEVGAGMHRKGLCCNDTWKRLLEQPPHASHAGAPLRVSTLVALPPELVLPVRSGLPPFQTLQAVTVTSPRQKQTTSRRAGLWGRSTRQVC